MKFRRRFLFALMASFLLHVAVVTGPGWYLPTLGDLLHPKKPQMLDAWLIKQANKAAPRPIPVPVPRPARPKPKPRSGMELVPQTPVSAPEPIPVPEVPPKAEAEDNPSAETVAPEAASNAIVLYPHVWIRYSVAKGEGGLIIGQAVEEFRNDGDTYFLRNTTETIGLARLFKPVSLIHSSEGQVVDGHLQPREFRIERNGDASESAFFDWPQRQVWLKERRFDLAPGTQDMLSMFCELALIPISGGSVSVPVVTGKKVENYEFTVVGEERLATPMGEQPTLHLRTLGTGDEKTDVWLGLDFARLPLRIRYVDRKGEVYDQVAGSIEIDPTIERPH